tara:strand:+ start:558 stop:1346 length:789 start_codon:yes stop_codon:yes gene_type:complete
MKFNNNLEEIRHKIREGIFTSTTSGLNPGYTQTNVAILPSQYALDFMIFCQRNPKSCPLVEVLTPGKFEARISSPNSDIRTDVPKYRIFQSGKMIDEVTDIIDYWRDDFVTFLLGCSFTFERALIDSGIQLKHYDLKKNVAMYISNINSVSSDFFSGNMVVSMRWIKNQDIEKAIETTKKYPSMHGEPIHIGDPEKIGILDISNPDFGDFFEPDSNNYSPVFWACGVTPQVVALKSKIPIMITHSPGHMFITDLRDDDFKFE